jgi:hypothetical protein
MFATSKLPNCWRALVLLPWFTACMATSVATPERLVSSLPRLLMHDDYVELTTRYDRTRLPEPSRDSAKFIVVIKADGLPLAGAMSPSLLLRNAGTLPALVAFACPFDTEAMRESNVACGYHDQDSVTIDDGVLTLRIANPQYVREFRRASPAQVKVERHFSGRIEVDTVVVRREFLPRGRDELMRGGERTSYDPTRMP